ncbi:DnaJ protein-like protein [Hortaea werneckii]|uniref:DnaJ-related protein SCJ1 n=1 Tax=Hortaea werneckii TaxID=91943 RepID=A0A3M7IHT8_HORWE|nr:DnaJ protein-like protein [Hortaea werneckii]KAI6816591.1 DnaJ protein-like protein [Hortaea werneckii]KAI6919556.1 DnaJ protein-like protein [Hortaea werneckii]KAI6922939.1 DnaJ protein-like protein [Hortaea werneckii]KAI6964833.1 DnaJ protein-like protein [Hortaea werneckii]
MLFFSTLALLCLIPLIALAAEDYYKLLGIDNDADDRQIKKAYRTLSKKYHPDKNPGDETVAKRFVEISEAYDVLSDDETRKIYDQYGHEGVKQHQQGGRPGARHDPFDLFSRFFGGGGHFGGGQRRGPNMEVRITVPLRDFYTGKDHDFKIEKQVICSKCEGSGSKDGQRDTCHKCHGQGMVIQKQMLAPGIFQQMQMQCDVCGGKGSTVKHACSVCKGSRVVREEEQFDLTVEKGMPVGARLTYENEGDESPDYIAGDLIVHLLEKDPEIGTEDSERTDGTFFRRKDANLFWREVLSLREAWMGDWSRNLTHLDGHVVHLHRPKGKVVQPGTVEVIEGEGMPVWRHEDGPEHGNLHIEYVVVLPDQMESGMEKDFMATWDKWSKKRVDLHKHSGRPEPKHDEL